MRGSPLRHYFESEIKKKFHHTSVVNWTSTTKKQRGILEKNRKLKWPYSIMALDDSKTERDIKSSISSLKRKLASFLEVKLIFV